MKFDIFNGDADGICALHQLRLSSPIPDAQLITGVKRDISLLARPVLSDIENCSLTVLDISMDKNRDSLVAILDGCNDVLYIDHHAASSIPESSHLKSHINHSAETCTSLIVNDMLNGAHADWAICGAFGDNLLKPAQNLSEQLSYTPEETEQLKEIGWLLNYNGYGTSIEKLHYHPRELYQAVSKFDSAFDFFHNSDQLPSLRQGYESDLESAIGCMEYKHSGSNRVWLFPDESWANRISGVFANMKAWEQPDDAHAIITHNNDDTLCISVRAPLNDKRGASDLCSKFPTGGGRAAAAGINKLPVDMLDSFLEAINATYSR